jgi:cytochrome P450
MAHDPTTYSDPFCFRPERFLGPDPEPDPTFVFGFGRRICPGRTLAQASMYIFAAYLLTFFDIKPARGPNSEELEAKVEYHGYSIM